MLQLLLGLVGTVAVIGAAVAAFYVFSYVVLYLVGKTFPLTGWRRRR